MARILSLETSTDVCSVAIHYDGKLISEAVIREPQAHASSLAPMILKILESSGLRMDSLQSVAVSAGPGSYTGLRIGTSTAKGICYSLNLPLIAVSTLEIMALQVQQNQQKKFLYCPMIDARRMEVYCQIFDDSVHPLSPIEARIVDEHSFQELLSHQKMLFFGNGAEKCKQTITHANAYFIDGIFPTASAMGDPVLKKFLNSDFEGLESFKPLYLKEFIAKKAMSL